MEGRVPVAMEVLTSGILCFSDGIETAKQKGGWWKIENHKTIRFLDQSSNPCFQNRLHHSFWRETREFIKLRSTVCLVVSHNIYIYCYTYMYIRINIHIHTQHIYIYTHTVYMYIYIYSIYVYIYTYSIIYIFYVQPYLDDDPTWLSWVEAINQATNLPFSHSKDPPVIKWVGFSNPIYTIIHLSILNRWPCKIQHRYLSSTSAITPHIFVLLLNFLNPGIFLGEIQFCTGFWTVFVELEQDFHWKLLAWYCNGNSTLFWSYSPLEIIVVMLSLQ